MLLTAAEIRRLWEGAHVRFRPFVLPKQLEPFVVEQIAAFLAGSDPKRKNAAMEGEIAAVIAASVWGPEEDGSPPASMIPTLNKVGQLDPLGLRTALDRILVFGSLLPDNGNGWYNRWPGAWNALRHLIRGLIEAPIWWIGDRVLGKRQQKLAHWVKGEVEIVESSGETGEKSAKKIRHPGELDFCTDVLAGNLATGRCTCCDRDSWRDRHLDSEEVARHRCHVEHRLVGFFGFSPAMSLQDFLHFVLVKGDLRLPDPKAKDPKLRKEIANVNGFRGSMLAALTGLDPDGLRGELVAGPVLRCTRDKCPGGEITLQDQCTGCGQLADVKDPSWWLWLKEDRQEHECRRCKGCDRLFFQGPGRFCLTRNALEELQKIGLSGEALDFLTALQGEEFPNEPRFVRKLAESKAGLARYQKKILKLAQAECPRGHDPGQWSKATTVWIPRDWAHYINVAAGPKPRAAAPDEGFIDPPPTPCESVSDLEGLRGWRRIVASWPAGDSTKELMEEVLAASNSLAELASTLADTSESSGRRRLLRTAFCRLAEEEQGRVLSEAEFQQWFSEVFQPKRSPSTGRKRGAGEDLPEE